MMKKILLFSALLFSYTLVNSQSSLINDYEIKIKIKNAESDTIYLANYLGKKLYYYDTTTTDTKGLGVFKGKQIPAGVYAVVTKGPKYFEIIVNEKKIELETSTDDFTKNMVIKHSEENKAFYEFITFMTQKKMKVYPLSEKLKDSTVNEDEKTKIKAEIEKSTEEVNAFQKTFDNKYSSKLYAANVLALNYDVEIPNNVDSTKRYHYYRTHYLDRIDFNDDRYVHSPAFHNKIESYFTKVLPQIPDTICAEAQRIISTIKDEKSDTWKYVVHYITNAFEQSKLMGMDKVLVFMAKNYYCSSTPSKAYWMREEKLKELCEKVDILDPILLGKYAPNLILQDTTEKTWVNIHQQIKSKWTILIFYDPNCGHCKEEMPKVKEFYDKYKDIYDLSVVAINSELDNKDWKKFIKDFKLDGWIHISDNPEIHNNPEKYIQKTTLESLNFRRTYDVFSTPQVYILDKDKIIRGKKIGGDQIEDLMKRLNSTH